MSTLRWENTRQPTRISIPSLRLLRANSWPITCGGSNSPNRRSKPKLALQQFQKAATLDPDNPTIKTQIGISEIDAGQGEQGLAALEQVFHTEAGAPIAGPALVITELRAQRFDQAAETAASLVKR